MVKAPKAKTLDKQITHDRTSSKGGKPKSVTPAERPVGGDESEPAGDSRLNANVLGPNDSADDGGWTYVSLEEILGDLSSPRGDREYWEEFDLPAEEFERLGYSNEYDDPVVGLSGVKPDSPVDARQILESFVERVRTGERLPWAIVRYLACAFEGMTGAGRDADKVAAAWLGLTYRHSTAKREEANLGRNTRIGFYVLDEVAKRTKIRQRGPVTAALSAAANKFGVDERVARTCYNNVKQQLRRNGIVSRVKSAARIRKRPD